MISPSFSSPGLVRASEMREGGTIYGSPGSEDRKMLGLGAASAGSWAPKGAASDRSRPTATSGRLTIPLPAWITEVCILQDITS